MRSRKHFRPKNKTLKQKIHNYISKKQDICCEEEIDRNILIDHIFSLYGKIVDYVGEDKEEITSYINNDLLIFIGFKITLEKNKDKEGVKLWEMLNRYMYKNKKLDKEKIITVLREVPLYYLLSFLGYAYYRYRVTEPEQA